MRISDWSSDVCSSDLLEPAAFRAAPETVGRGHAPTGFRRPCRSGHREPKIKSRRGRSPDLRERHVAALHDAHWRVAGVAREHRAEPVVAHAPYQQLRQHTAEVGGDRDVAEVGRRSEEHTSELQSLMRISYAVFC